MNLTLTPAHTSPDLMLPGEYHDLIEAGIEPKFASYICELAPEIRQLESPEGTWIFEITQHPHASLISCVLTGDKNRKAHYGPNGVQHTPMRIGDFALGISFARPGALVRNITREIFTIQVPLGKTVRIEVSTHQKRGETVVFEVAGFIAETNQPIAKSAKVTTVRA